MKTAVVLGTRAELIKTFPVINELEKRSHEVQFISTGQHHLEDTCEMLKVKKPDTILTETVEDSSKFNGSKVKAIAWNLKLLFKLRNTIIEQKPDYVLYHGDTMTTASAAVSSSRIMAPLRKFKTAHIEAGLRSGSIREPFPEEISRIIADILSNILFSVSYKSSQNLRFHNKFGKKVFNTGNTVTDSVEIAEKKESYNEDYSVATVHRHENISSKDRMTKIVKILEQSPYTVKFFMHDNTKKLMKKHGLMNRIKQNKKIEVTSLKQYPEFLSVLKNSSLIYTDGGSIQEESLIFKVPCVLLRKRTERKEGLETDLNYLSELNPDNTQKYVDRINDIDRETSNPYGEKGASKRIVDKLEEIL